MKGSVHKCEFFPTGANDPSFYSDALYERKLYPEDLTEKGIELHVASATRRHLLNLLEAIDTGSKPVADVMNGHISTASCILANMAMETGDILEYDPVRQKIVKNRTANKLLTPDYRNPWQRP